MYTPAYALAALALFVVSLAETGRVPFDNPETHYELTMIHEGMLLEYSGKPLGLMFWSAWTKQFLILSLLANILFPFHMATSANIAALALALLAFIGKLIAVGLIIVIVETAIAKMRLFRVKEVLGASLILAVLALIFSVEQSGGLPK
ncbi:MAG: NADH-quinone oxidoreductase subunit H [Vampirovibrionales bacterium]